MNSEKVKHKNVTRYTFKNLRIKRLTDQIASRQKNLYIIWLLFKKLV